MKTLPKHIKIKNIKFNPFFATLVILLSSYFLLHSSIYAQEAQRTYTVINPQVEVSLNPGETSEGITEVINETEAPLTFKLVIRDYIVNDTKGTPNFLPPNTLNSKYSATSWMDVTPNTFTLEPKKSQKINYYIKVPANAKPGGHYAGIVYTPDVIAQKGTGGIVTTQVGSLFYITVKGETKENASVAKFSSSLLHEFGPVTLLTQIKNLGDLHIKPKGKIAITGLFVNEKFDFAEQNIFPETARDFESLVGQKLMFGPYKADLLLTYGNNNSPLNASLFFFVFPWRIAMLVILIIIAVVLGIKYHKKRKSKKQDQNPITADNSPVSVVPPLNT